MSSKNFREVAKKISMLPSDEKLMLYDCLNSIAYHDKLVVKNSILSILKKAKENQMERSKVSEMISDTLILNRLIRKSLLSTTENPRTSLKAIGYKNLLDQMKRDKIPGAKGGLKHDALIDLCLKEVSNPKKYYKGQSLLTIHPLYRVDAFRIYIYINGFLVGMDDPDDRIESLSEDDSLDFQ